MNLSNGIPAGAKWAWGLAGTIVLLAIVGMTSLQVADTHCNGFIHRLNAKFPSLPELKHPVACTYE